MKIYVASSFDRKEEVLEIYSSLREMGFETVDWTRHKRIIPFNENTATASLYAAEDSTGVIRSDIFARLCGSTGNTHGHKTEHGIAIASYIFTGKPVVYAIGDPSDSMFNFHPATTRIPTVEQFLEEMRRKP